MILTKLDGDARGGAALSVRKVTGVPIKFIGQGEKLDKLAPFDPERLVGQMLGMGDIVGLVEAAQGAVDADEAARQQEKLAKGKFDLNDFRQQLTQMKKMGSVKDLMGMIPGMNQMAGNLEGVDADGEVKRIQGIIDSMTKAERKDPHLIDISRGGGSPPAPGSPRRTPNWSNGSTRGLDGQAMSQMSMLDKIRPAGWAAPVRSAGAGWSPQGGRASGSPQGTRNAQGRERESAPQAAAQPGRDDAGAPERPLR